MFHGQQYALSNHAPDLKPKFLGTGQKFHESTIVFSAWLSASLILKRLLARECVPWAKAIEHMGCAFFTIPGVQRNSRRLKVECECH